MSLNIWIRIEPIQSLSCAFTFTYDKRSTPGALNNFIAVSNLIFHRKRGCNTFYDRSGFSYNLIYQIAAKLKVTFYYSYVKLITI